MHHLVESARALGLAAEVDLEPDPDDLDLLARVRLSPGRPPPDAAERLTTLERRCTDRRRFTSWPIPDEKLHELAETADGWGAHAVPVTDVTARFRAELLVDRAIALQAADPRFEAEQSDWIDHTSSDGVPLSSAAPPVSRRLERPNRFAPRPGLDRTRRHRLVESPDGLIAICTAHDDQRSWLRSGQTLSAMWLSATAAGLSIVPLSQVVEVPETRHALHHDVFADLARPQLLVRIGWQEIARTTLPRTPRRPLDDVLVT